MDSKPTPKSDAAVSTGSRTVAKIFLGVSIGVLALVLGGFFFLLFRPLK